MVNGFTCVDRGQDRSIQDSQYLEPLPVKNNRDRLFLAAALAPTLNTSYGWEDII
jgi:hypothetical protein